MEVRRLYSFLVQYQNDLEQMRLKFVLLGFRGLLVVRTDTKRREKSCMLYPSDDRSSGFFGQRDSFNLIEWSYQTCTDTLARGFSRPAASSSSCNCTRNDAVSGIFFMCTCIALSKNSSLSRISIASRRFWYVCIRTLAATYRQKATKG